MRALLAWFAGAIALVPLAAGSAWSQIPPQPVELAQVRTKGAPSAAAAGEAGAVARTNAWTVGVAGGLLEGTFIRFAAELAKALDDGDNLRVLPVVTFGAADNVSDLLYLKGIDISITHADVFDEFRRNRKASNVERRIHYISQMYIGELHVFARHDIKSIKDLEGKTVGFHTKGAGPTITGPILFERLGIKVKPVHINNAIAIEKMKTGEIAAILHTVGKPNNVFVNLKSDVGHFLPVEYTEKFSDYYVPSTLEHEDYPNLFKPGEKVETIGIPVVLAVYNWSRENDRFRRVERFIQYYFEHFDTLRKPPFHPKWKEINLAAKVPGWTRFSVAEEMLAKMQADKPVAQTTAIDPNYARTQAARAAPGDRAEQERLFQQFLEWSRQRTRR
ncbi:MAG: ABC transporter substrate-binding protein [Hyphomicrobiaceae bacterium]|nr:ABC transporter substrate-binding protein [Hyphomicrobiaceae bacterium]